MKKVVLLPALILSVIACMGQIKPSSGTKAPGLMLGLDSTLVKMEYARWNNANPDEAWEVYSIPGRIVFYCEWSSNKNRSNVAHVYDFDENGTNFKYTTIATQERFKYATDYLNNVALRNRYIYEYKGVNEFNQGVWVSSKFMADYTGCDCGNLKVTVTANIPDDGIQNIVEVCPVKPGKSGELLSIVYTPLND
ncbi:MAG TPA: hypothetical protein PLV51_06465 [Lentimicrobium sp.]|jgi:hypothetical protein|nr:hypothetical protein [Lentimicrobium sp.]